MNRRELSKPLTAAVGACLLVLGAAQADANVYASGLTVDATQFEPSLGQTVEIGYILNENADDNVKIEVLDGSMTAIRTVNLGPQAKGPQSWTWNGKDDGSAIVADGNYSVQITASDDGHGDWEVLSDTFDLVNSFYVPRSVDINRNADGPYFGRIYVVEGGGPNTTASGRSVTDGIYILNADHTDAIGQGDAAQSGGVAWGEPADDTGAFSPKFVRIGEDNKVYLADHWDGHSGVWVGDPDFNAAVELLSNAGQDPATGRADNHGSVSAIWLEGSGDNLVLYTSEEEWPDVFGATDPGPCGTIYKYPVGTATQYAELPETIYDDVALGNPIQNYNTGLFRDSDGYWWTSQYRASAATTIPCILKIDTDGSSILWTSMDLDGGFDIYGGAIVGDPFFGTNNGLWIDEVRDRLFGSGYVDGYCVLLQWTTLDPGTLDYFIAGSRIRGLTTDPAGNLYTVDSNEELLKQWSPPDGANSYATPSWFTLQVGEAVVPTEIQADIARTGANQVEVSWTGAAASKTQTVESRDAFGSGAWTDVGNGSGEAGSIADDVTGVDGREYRVRQD